MRIVPKWAQSTLRLLTGQGPQPKIGLRRRARSQPRHAVAEVIGRAAVTALARHRIQTARPQARVAGQRLDDEPLVGVDHRATRQLRRQHHAGLLEHPAHRAVVGVQLPRDGADRPALGVVQTQDLHLEGATDHREPPSSRPAAQRTQPRERGQRAAAETADRSAHLASNHTENADRAGSRRAMAYRGGIRGIGCMGCMGWDSPGRRVERHNPARDPRHIGTLMRHFLRRARSPAALPGSVQPGTAAAALVAPAGAVHRLTTALLGAPLRAILVAAVALAADAHLLRAAGAAVEPIGGTADLHAGCP